MNLKIFGERNTGTTALELNLKNNFPNHVLNGDLGIGNFSKLNFKYFKIKLKRKILRISKASRAKIEDNYDEFFKSTPIDYQWKHCATNFNNDQIKEISKKKIHFIFTIRDPLSWVKSLNQKKYHLLNKNDSSLEDFMHSEIEVWERENLTQKKLKPLKLYEEKLKSYRKFIIQLEAFNLTYTVLKFEDLILNHKGCYNQIASDIGALGVVVNELVQSTDNNNKDLNFYKNYYGNQTWKQDIPKTILENFQFDRNLLQWMGYNY